MKNNEIISVTLRKDREKSVHLRHPWIFSGALISSGSHPPSIAHVFSQSGELLGSGIWNPHSGIRIRLYTFPGEEPVTPDNASSVLYNKITEALKRRRNTGPQEAERLIFAESDGMPGLIADRYAEGITVQFLSWSSHFFRETIIKILTEVLKPAFIYERSDSEALTQEGLKPSAGLISGKPVRDSLIQALQQINPALLQESAAARCFPPEYGITASQVIKRIDSLKEDPDSLLIKENEYSFAVNLRTGHKTGMYTDQKANRARVRDYCRGNVLNVFSYTGGFTVPAVGAGASSVTCVDDSSEALITDYLNNLINFQDLPPISFVKGDAFQILRTYRDEGRQFDCVILDPPKFAFTQKQAESAAKGYKDINLLGLKLVKSGGHLITFSCSGNISGDFFQKIVFGAATDAGKSVRITERLSQGPDHAVLLNFPESFYLKGFILSVT